MTQPKKFRVLFVCLGNACRSPMAESIALHRAPDIMEPSSAGLSPLGRIPEPTRQALLARGYPVEGLFSKPLNREAAETADRIINLAGAPRDRAFDTLANVEDWEVEDPYGQDPTVYQRILKEIESRVLSLASQLRADPSVDQP